jgi:hypothetical protein
MKAVGFASVLASALSEAQSFTDRSHGIEAIRNVLIEAEGNSLRVTGMNLATGFTTSVEAQVGEGGRMVIPATQIGKQSRDLCSTPIPACSNKRNWSYTASTIPFPWQGTTFNGRITYSTSPEYAAHTT